MKGKKGTLSLEEILNGQYSSAMFIKDYRDRRTDFFTNGGKPGVCHLPKGKSYRLTEPCRNLIRVLAYILKTTHENGKFFNGLIKIKNVVFEDWTKPKLTNGTATDGSSDFRRDIENDYKDLKIFIKNLIKCCGHANDPVPRELDSFYSLLDNPIGKQYHIVNHWVLWDSERIMRFFSKCSKTLSDRKYHKKDHTCVLFKKSCLKGYPKYNFNFNYYIPVRDVLNDVLCYQKNWKLGDPINSQYNGEMYSLPRYMRNTFEHGRKDKQKGKYSIKELDDELYTSFPFMLDVICTFLTRHLLIQNYWEGATQVCMC